MKLSFKTLGLALFCSLSTLVNASPDVADSLSEFAWEKRQILLFAPDMQDKRYQAFIAEEAKQSAAFVERRLQVWHLVADQPVKLDHAVRDQLGVADFQAEYGVAVDEFRVILIGYDQGEKLRQERVDVEYIFATIDQMPMRLEEMRRSE